MIPPIIYLKVKRNKEKVMIENKADYRNYLYQDQLALGMENKKLFTLIICRCEKDYILKYQRLLRKTEYVKNCIREKSVLGELYFRWLTYRLLRYKIKLGFDIPPNVFGPGLCIVHTGPIIIRGWAKVGKNCRIYPMTNIGNDGMADGAEQMTEIGDNCFISTGVKIIGKVKICDHVTLGAGAVVVKDIMEENSTWGGVPAKKISNHSIL